MKAIDRYHEQHVFGRRIRVLAGHFAELLPQNASVLDVGSGDGSLAASILQRRPDLRIEGVDVLVRPSTAIPVRAFDGTNLPFADGAYDAVMLCDVIHHITDARPLLREVTRVAKQQVAIKDHFCESWLDLQTLRFMDWVGNARHGVALPYNYWPRRQWMDTFRELGLTVETMREDLHIYNAALDLLFGRSLHFAVSLSRNAR